LKPNATVTDVARLAGVSVATVSRTFTQPELVSEAARARVTEAALRLAFSPNPAARALRRRRSHLVGAVIPTLSYAIYARLVNAFQERMGESGHLTLVLTSGFDNARLPEKARLLIEHGCEGLLLVGQIYDPSLLLLVQQRGVPTVSTYSVTNDAVIPSIGFDNRDAMLRALQHAAELGHRDILLLLGPLKGNDRQIARRAAFVETMRRRKQPISNRIVECEYTIEAGERAFRDKWLEGGAFTCVLCSSDVLAFGVLAECRRLGVRVPDELSVIGFDDFEFSVRLDPPLTTIRVPSEEMGRLSAEAILNALQSQSAIVPQVLDAPLIVRRSTAPARPRGDSPPASPKQTLRQANQVSAKV
jgi:LacI family transcriptional regulator